VKAVSAIRIRGVVEVKEGKSEEFRQACRELVEAVREGEPDTVSYGTFLDEATGTGIFLEHYSDSAGMLAGRRYQRLRPETSRRVRWPGELASPRPPAPAPASS
jgi:quinol monooxygenase YgiN